MSGAKIQVRMQVIRSDSEDFNQPAMTVIRLSPDGKAATCEWMESGKAKQSDFETNVLEPYDGVPPARAFGFPNED